MFERLKRLLPKREEFPVEIKWHHGTMTISNGPALIHIDEIKPSVLSWIESSLPAEECYYITVTLLRPRPNGFMWLGITTWRFDPENGLTFLSVCGDDHPFTLGIPHGN